MQNICVVSAVTVALIVSGCSSRPREFAPTLAVQSTSTAALDASMAECSQLFIAGKLDQNGRTGSGAAGAAPGGAMAVAGGAAAASAGPYAGMALASATLVLLPFAALGGAWGMARMKRAKKEKAIKTAMTGCLQERGHQVVGWEKTGRKMPKPSAKAPAN